MNAVDLRDAKAPLSIYSSICKLPYSRMSMKSKRGTVAESQASLQPPAHKPDSLHSSHLEISWSTDNECMVLSTWRSEWPLVVMKSAWAEPRCLS